jgi:hypothetical protein
LHRCAIWKQPPLSEQPPHQPSNRAAPTTPRLLGSDYRALGSFKTPWSTKRGLTTHSNMDLYDRVQAGDLRQGSAIIVWFVYNTANRAEMMPRLDLPGPLKQRVAAGSPTN